MTKALRITSVLTAVAVLVLLVVQVAFPAPVAKKPIFTSIVDKIKKDKGSRTATKSKDVSPLVKQAQNFALYLNPPKPKPKPQKIDKKATPKGARPKATINAKFKLIGTSTYPTHPELSLALIDEPGKGRRWVRQSTSVGHLIIYEVKSGSIIVKDGSKTSELIAERPAKKSLIKGKSPTPAITGSSTITTTQPVAPEKLKAEQERGRRKMAELAKVIGSMQMSGEETEKLDSLEEGLKNTAPAPNAPPKAARTNDSERLSKIKAARELRRTRKPSRRSTTR